MLASSSCRCLRVSSRAASRGSGASSRFASNGSRVTMKAAKSPVASGYANALMEIAQANNAVEAVHNDVDNMSALLRESKDTLKFLANPVLVASKKKDVLAKIAKEAEFNAFTLNFLSLLVDKKRINAVESILEEFETLYCEVTETQVATVTSAVQLENEQQFLIAKKLQELTGAKNIKLKPEIDEDLIAGFVVRYGKDGSGMIDMSVKGRLEKLAAQMMAAPKSVTSVAM
ncbi:F-type H+-transporting ATPase subunit delta [Pseudoscourfieldia marina]